MNATTLDVLPESSGATLRDNPAPDDVVDPTEDLANEMTAELSPGSLRWTKTAARAPSGHGIATIEPIGRAPMIAVGSVLRDRYVLERLLANGGTALIFRAHDLRRDALAAGGPRVALKLLRPELSNRPQHIARLQREFRQTESLQHPSIVRFHDLDCDRGVWFIVMELLSGETLGPRLRRSAPGSMPAAEILAIASAAADALGFAHERGVVHGDVKPDNLFLTTPRGLRMLDFGVAPALPVTPDATDLEEGVVAAATRAYASPQVLAGERPAPADDVFSLACVIFEMASGRHPWGRRGVGELQSAELLLLEQPPALDARQWSVVSAALAWCREDRPDLHEFKRALCDPRPTAGITGSEALSVVPVPAPTAVAAPEPPAPLPSARSALGGRWRFAATAAIAFFLGLVLNRFGQDAPRPAGPDLVSKTPSSVAVAMDNDAPAARLAEAAVATATDALAPPVAAAVAGTEARPTRTKAGFVAFESESMAVSRRAVVAAIPLRHFTDAPRGVQVGWRVLEGSAVAGRDFGGPQSGIAHFAEGNTFRMIFVPVNIDPAAAGERTFAVELTDASSGAALGTMRRILVRILDDA